MHPPAKKCLQENFISFFSGNKRGHLKIVADRELEVKITFCAGWLPNRRETVCFDILPPAKVKISGHSNQHKNSVSFSSLLAACRSAGLLGQNGKFETVADCEIRAGSATRRPKSRRATNPSKQPASTYFTNTQEKERNLQF